MCNSSGRWNKASFLREEDEAVQNQQLGTEALGSRDTSCSVHIIRGQPEHEQDFETVEDIRNAVPVNSNYNREFCYIFRF